MQDKLKNQPKTTCCGVKEKSEKPVRYSNGELELVVRDLGSSGYGLPWGHVRVYSNQMSSDFDFGNGYNWLVPQRSYIEEVGTTTLVVVRSTETSVWFDLVDSVWTPRHGAAFTLVHDTAAGVYKMTGPNGHVWEFNDFQQTARPQGLFRSHTIGGGQKLEVTSYTADGDFGEVQRSYTSGGTTTVESYLYSYFASGAHIARLEFVTLRRKVDAGAWTDIRRAKYTYYGSGESNGLLGDLKTATVQVLIDSTWTDQENSHYRYYLDAAGGIGFAHGLKYVLGPEAYRRLAAVTDPLTATNAQVAQYAGFYFEYNADRRVTKEVTDGGSFTLTFSYTTSAHADAYNNWKRKTVETRPDGSQYIVYTNYVGEVIVKELKSGTSRWIEHQKFDAEGRMIEHANPSAVTGYNETFANLNVALKASDGLIEVIDYYTTTGGVAAKGHVQHEKIKRGASGTEVKLRTFEYTSRSSGGVTIYPVSKETVYRNEDGTGLIDTSFAYTWHGTTFEMQDFSTTWPLVPTSQNGSGVADSRTVRHDQHGNPVWIKDARGFITRHKPDVVTGALTQIIQDVDTAQTTDEPTGWATPAGGGLHVVTDFEFDDLGRITQVLGPSHEVDLAGTATVVRTADWTVYKDVEAEVWTGRGYATGTAPNYTHTLVNPVSVSKMDDAGGVTDSIAAIRSSTAGRLSAGDSFPQSSWVRWTTSTYNDKSQLTGRRVYHAIPASGSGSSGTNYDETTFAYSPMDRQNMEKSPGGTITRTVFDVRGLATAVYVGTNDTGATDADPTGGGATGNNMVLVTENEYDAGLAGGDANLTKLTQHVDATTSRITAFGHDWRNRQTGIDGEVDFYQQNTFDNLERVTRVDRRNTTVTGNLVARSDVRFDDRGRVYQSIQYAVDPATGSVGNTLTDDTWFDAAGHVIKHFPAGSKAFAKSMFDGLGRETKQYVGYDMAETSYSDAGNVTGDTVFEQVETSYDAAGNVIQTTVRRRFHNATGTGELTTPSGLQPKARVSYVALYPDAMGRQQVVADYGTNGGSAFSRSSVIPARSDTVLVSSTEYNSDGEAFKANDPNGTETRQEFDDAGRRIKLIENYIDGDPATGTADEDRTTQWTYNADGRVKSLTAKNPTTGDQVTKYVFGTTLTESEIARSDVLRAVIYPDSDDVESPLGAGADGIYDRVEHKANRQSETKETKDQNGTVHAYDFDKLGRQTQDRVVTLGTGVDGAVRRTGTTHEVRGLVEKVTSYDNATVGLGNVVNEVQLAYNAFGQLAIDYQEHGAAVNTSSSAKVQYTYGDGSGNHVRPTKVAYPNGRILRLEYNSGSDSNLSRVSFLADDNAGAVGAHLAEYSYLGLVSIVKVDYTEPDIRMDLAHGAATDPYDGGLDRFGRVIDLLWRNYGTSADVERVQHGYDRASKRLWREAPVAAANGRHLDELYSYDGLYQLKTFKRGDLNGTKDGIIAGTLALAQEWGLDATGNWSNFKEDADGNGLWDLDQPRTHNKTNEIQTITATIGPDWIDSVHDRAGNMTTMPQPAVPTSSYAATWDAWNRLVKLMDGVTTVGEYGYDGLFRRTKKLVSGTTRHFYYADRWQVLEERLGASGLAHRQFAWGLRYIDDLVLRDEDTNVPADGILDERLYAMQDPTWNVTALAGTSGAIVERYSYSAHGLSTVLTPTFGSRLGSLYEWENRFTGRDVDLASGLHNARRRSLHATLGRWLTPDGLGYVDGMNLYAAYFVINGMDPMGDLVWPWDPRADWVWPWDPRANRDPRQNVRLWWRTFCNIANLGNNKVANDIITCACFGVGIADMIPGLIHVPGVEKVDCACNILSTAQTACNRGLSWGAFYLAMTAVDCLSLPLGAAVGGALGLPVGAAAGGPKGALVGMPAGVVLGDAIVDVAAFVAQNYAAQGTIIPVAQVQACCDAASLTAKAAGAAAREINDAFERLRKAAGKIPGAI